MRNEARLALPQVRSEVAKRLRRRRMVSTSAIVALIGLAIALPLVLTATNGSDTKGSHQTPIGTNPGTVPTTTAVPPGKTSTTTSLLPGISSRTTQPTAGAHSGGATLSASSEPRSGTLGSTSIQVTATLAGIGPRQTGSLEFDIGQGPYNTGQPASVESVDVNGPGTYAMPTPYKPQSAGSWYVTVDFGFTNGPGGGLSVSGMPSPSNPHPDPDLVTTVTSLPGAPPCISTTTGGNAAGIRPALIFIGCATSNDHLSVITWTSWTATGAAGTAIHAVNNCQPNCAQGTFTTYPVRVQLSNPGYANGMLVFKTIALTPTTSAGSPESTSLSWGWVPSN
jgi:hypothetical protein